MNKKRANLHQRCYGHNNVTEFYTRTVRCIFLRPLSKSCFFSTLGKKYYFINVLYFIWANGNVQHRCASCSISMQLHSMTKIVRVLSVKSIKSLCKNSKLIFYSHYTSLSHNNLIKQSLNSVHFRLTI